MSFRSLKLPRLAVFGFLAVVGAMTASSAKADSVSFATFAQKNTGNQFVYSHTGTAGAGGVATYQTNPASIPVNFRYIDNTPFTTGLNPLLLGNQNAHLKMVVTSTDSVLIFGGLAFQQNFSGFIEITRDATLGGLSKLLRVDFTGTLSGLNGGSTATLGADTSPLIGDSITYSSDFIDFSGASEENLSLTYTSLSPTFIRDVGIKAFFKNFTATGTGSFAAAAVPEPGTIAGAFAGIALAGLAAARRRSAKV